jgi:hypothetical protein
LQKEKRIVLPAEILKDYLTPGEAVAFNESSQGIFSITVYAGKPASYCAPGCCA